MISQKLFALRSQWSPEPVLFEPSRKGGILQCKKSTLGMSSVGESESSGLMYSPRSFEESKDPETTTRELGEGCPESSSENGVSETPSGDVGTFSFSGTPRVHFSYFSQVK